ncbi:MAG TPA: Holliday junction resolvase RuvX [Coriobacteriia bacterium]|nr:Holliday junction resolvase RuvX [Coriobacteriia bacterium]
MRILALDIGEKRIGVAVSDPTQRVASPVCVLDAPQALASKRDFERLQQDYDDIELLLVGLPRSLDGTEGPQAARVREVAVRIGELTGLPLAYCDERLSSVEASRRMAEAGADSRARRGSVDMVAAALMLQAYLDEKWSDR